MASQDMSNSSGMPERDYARPFRLTAGDLMSDLLWPKLFRVPRLAIQPGRVMLAVLLILLVGLLDQTLAGVTPAEDEAVVIMLGERFGAGLANAGEQAMTLQIGDAIITAWKGAWYGITQTFRDAPWRASFVLPVAFLLYITLSVGISRMAVDDFARGRKPGWTEGLAWSLRGFWASLVAHLIPIAVIVLLGMVLVVGGFALLSVPFLNIIGAVFSVIGVVIALIAVLMILGFFLGGPMLSPAIAAEGFDGIESMQRIYSYVFTRPARLAMYATILFVQFAIVSSIAVALAYATSALTSWGAGLIFDWTGNADGMAVASGTVTEGMGWSGKAAGSIVETVLKLPGLIAAGFMLSYWICGWSVQYLLLRNAADGQDVTDIYVPGEMEARVERALAARAAGIEVDQASGVESDESDDD
ncbi:MAG: hypothetical protein KDA31_01105 [Phycisphaerales bacterium]|nr:hypothetical protein [Phycisphaerales bacterium]MCB9836980.1 hypothetical protein [Phycisphaera sp.]